MNTPAPILKHNGFIIISDDEKEKKTSDFKDREETGSVEQLVSIKKASSRKCLRSLLPMELRFLLSVENINSAEKKSKEAVDLSEEKSDEPDKNSSLKAFSLEEE